MKKYKNFLRLTLLLIMTLALAAGCNSKDNNPTGTETTANDNSKDANVDFSYSDGIDENGFWEGTKALDYVEIFDYKALPIPSDIHQISDETVQTEINNMLTYFSTDEQIKDRAVVDGDTVNIDYVGSVDGVEFEGGTTAGAGTDVTIGVTSYIDDFLEQLIGHMPGETFNVEVTFPEVYQNESLQGKDAVFVTTINYITEKTEPELTDEFVKSNLYDLYGWETITTMKEGMFKEIQKVAIQQYISDYLVNEVTVSSIPDKVMRYQEKAMMQYYKEGADYYQMELEEFLSSNVGMTDVNELIEANVESNTKNATYSLVAQAVAEDAGISVSEDDLTKYIPDYTPYVEQYGLPYLKQIVLSQKIIDYIADNAVLA